MAVCAVGCVEAEESVELVAVACVESSRSVGYGMGGEGFGEDGSVVLVLVYHDGAEAYGVDLWSVEVYGLELGAAEYLVGEEVDG